MKRDDPKERSSSELGSGPEPWRRTLTQTVIQAYADASGDHNPVHLDPNYARQAGLPGTIAHGMLTLGSAAAHVETWAGEGHFVEKLQCRFSAPVPAGEEVSFQGRAETGAGESLSVAIDARLPDGEKVLTRAQVRLRRLT
ncbi:MAG: MaoC/PaaZ C-terminal domain-containing protein [Candidatus Dormibacteria bacterium]